MTILPAALALVSLALWFSPLATATPREQRFDDDWRFLPGDPVGAEKNDFPDADWRVLDLPHDWSVEGEFRAAGNASGTGYLPGGTG